MFEAVTRAAADKPDVRKHRMTINQEIAVRSVLILADARLKERRGAHVRQSPREMRAHDGESFRCDVALARVWIKHGPVQINCELETALLKVGQRVNQFREIQ